MRWDATPYQPDPPAITEAEAAEQRKLRVATVLNLVIFWVVAAALGASVVWVILTARPL